MLLHHGTLTACGQQLPNSRSDNQAAVSELEQGKLAALLLPSGNCLLFSVQYF
jgi:hypothetical protein